MRRYLTDLQKKIFALIHSPRSPELYRCSEKDFTRASPLSFANITKCILNLFKESVEYNIQEILPELLAPVVTSSAFTQARYKISPTFFNDLNGLTVESYMISNKRYWKEHVLLAGDGSSLNLPISDDIKDVFGVHATTSHGVDRCAARIFFMHDVLNNIVVDSRLDRMDTGEKSMLYDILETIAHMEGLFLLDRNFGYFSVLKHLMLAGRDFCVRFAVGASNFTKNVMEDERNDFITEWWPSRKERLTCSRDSMDSTPINVRIVKVVLDTGDNELLITSLLNQEEYTTEDIKELYHLRWGVEECFKKLKPKMKIEQFGCKKGQGVLQEFYAHIFTLNMTNLVAAPAQDLIERKTIKRRLNYKYNWRNAIEKMLTGSGERVS
ncbi:IS4 family transposase [Chondrinema litorale]|uniref:IS4 family transposase n=1 Tax=Chondrinema litorale TaxID=2994555 RepID=UPI002543BF6E|nr:IS4 family transposase [Chondrinema litorale]UZS00117.1 IS4 family transposase [Chondrinema litorale]